MANRIEACAADDIANEDVPRFDRAGRTFANYRSANDKYYAKLSKEFERIQHIRIDAFKSFVDEVQSGAYPEPQHIVGIAPAELAVFKAKLTVG